MMLVSIEAIFLIVKVYAVCAFPCCGKQTAKGGFLARYSIQQKSERPLIAYRDGTLELTS